MGRYDDEILMAKNLQAKFANIPNKERIWDFLRLQKLKPENS